MSLELQDIFAPLSLLERMQPCFFGVDPKGNNILYTNAKTVIIRDIKNPKKCSVYTGHVQKATVAKYAPSGYYVCSGDAAGNIHIWDPQNLENEARKKFRPLAAVLKDLEWDGESKRIAMCGQGSDKHAAAVTADSGNNVGKITGVLKMGNSIAIKPNRPYRLVAADETGNISFYPGPPFNFDKNVYCHEKMATCIRYSSDGKYFASASSDQQVVLFDGKTGDVIGNFGAGKAHTGTVYALCWSPDGKEILTVSADKTAKIWNVETREEVVKFLFGSDVGDQQYSCAWIGDVLITMSFSGCINYLDRNNPEKPLKVIHGHNRPVSQVINVPSDKLRYVSGDFSGKLLMFDSETGDAVTFNGGGHSGKIVGLDYDVNSQEIISTGFDDKVLFTCSKSLDLSSSTAVSLDSQPSSLRNAGKGCVVVNTQNSLVLIKDKKKVFELQHDEEYQPNCLAVNGNTVAVEKEGKGLQLYEIQGDSLVIVDGGPALTATAAGLAFSPDGSMLAVAQNDKVINIYMVSDGYKLSKRLIGHTSVPKILSWSPNSQFLASSSIASDLTVWEVARDYKDMYPRAHAGVILTIAWQNDSVLLTGGDDSLIKQWTFKA